MMWSEVERGNLRDAFELVADVTTKELQVNQLGEVFQILGQMVNEDDLRYLLSLTITNRDRASMTL